MVFIEWTGVSKFIIGGLLTVLAVAFAIFGRKKWSRGELVIACTPLLFIGGLLVLWGRIIVTSNDATEPIYSPDRRLAARVNIGPFGEEAVELFHAHGLRKEIVYWGDVDLMHWADSSHLIIENQHEGDYGEGKSCPGSRLVSISCVATSEAAFK